MGEIAKLNLTFDMYGRKYEDGRVKTFSEVLEEMDPTPEGSSLDAFERQMKVRGIYTKDVPQMGLRASTVETFFLADDNKAMFPEYMNRGVRSAWANNNILTALIGATSTVDSDLVKTNYVDRPDRKKTRKRRITERTELPVSKIGSREQAVRFYKYGRAIDASYESLRRMKLDMLQRLVNFIVNDAALDKAEEAIYTFIKGDGNGNAATVHNLSALDSAAAGKLTAKAWLNYLMKFDVFPCDTLIATKDAFMDIVTTQVPGLDATQVLSLMANGNLSGVRLSTPQMPQSNQTLLWHEDVADADFTGKVVLGFNKAAGLEELVEQGSSISESQRFIQNQTQIMTISENSGFSKMFKESAYVLDLGA